VAAAGKIAWVEAGEDAADIVGGGRGRGGREEVEA
jgi:hypothetical protein